MSEAKKRASPMAPVLEVLANPTSTSMSTWRDFVVVTVPVIYLTQLVYVHEGCEAMFQEFEDIVLPLLAKHRGELLLRLRPDRASKIAGSHELPYELHVVTFESEDDVLRYSNDEERKRVLGLKDQSVKSTLIIKGTRA